MIRTAVLVGILCILGALVQANNDAHSFNTLGRGAPDTRKKTDAPKVTESPKPKETKAPKTDKPTEKPTDKPTKAPKETDEPKGDKDKKTKCTNQFVGKDCKKCPFPYTGDLCDQCMPGLVEYPKCIDELEAMEKAEEKKCKAQCKQDKCDDSDLVPDDEKGGWKCDCDKCVTAKKKCGKINGALLPCFWPTSGKCNKNGKCMVSLKKDNKMAECVDC